LISHPKIVAAMQILIELGLPRAQQNDRSALTLLALLHLQPEMDWKSVTAPLIGITPIMDWIRQHYGKQYKPNTRETIRRQTMHQFVLAGIALYNPDDPARPVNSPRAVYQVSPEVLALFKNYGKANWAKQVAVFQGDVKTLTAKYARKREMELIPVKLTDGTEIRLSPGKHSALIRDIITEFAPRFAPGSLLIYAGDTGEKVGYFDHERLKELGVLLNNHGKMPDVIIFDLKRNWLLLIESVTSHGPVDGKRHYELMQLFGGSTAGLVYVTAFPTRAVMARYLSEIAWESEVWVADAPTHLIHFNGVRFLGPYDDTNLTRD
jgi:BsuBI/PstI restriction endonuclease domain/BsuBI/PstI restriction endonuclease HTH domain